MQNCTSDKHIHSRTHSSHHAFNPTCIHPRTEPDDGILILFLFSALPFSACGEGGDGYIDPNFLMSHITLITHLIHTITQKSTCVMNNYLYNRANFCTTACACLESSICMLTRYCVCTTASNRYHILHAIYKQLLLLLYF